MFVPHVTLKAKAFGIHLTISLAIFLVLLYFIVYHWYPTPFFTTDGGWQGIRLIAFVDVVLGPTLTFIVYNPVKKSLRHLRMDLGLIALFQVAALIWGVWTVHNERPYLVIFSDRTFYAMPYYQIKDTGLTQEALSKLGDTPPIKVFTDIPSDPDERFKLFAIAIERQQPLHFISDFYLPFDNSHLEKLIQSSIDMETYLQDKDKNAKLLYQEFTKKHQAQSDNFLYFPLHARYGQYIVVLNKQTLEFVDVLGIKPPVIDQWEGIEKYRQKHAQNN
jgi:hypothetical protein